MDFLSDFGDDLDDNRLENIVVKSKKETFSLDPSKIITYKDYYNKKVDLLKYKLPELKELIRIINKNNNGVKILVTGNKHTLIDRLIEYFHLCLKSLTIQKIYRGFIVRNAMKIHGPAMKDRKLCVNESDGYTLEPLDEIAFERFISYKDNKGFIYGFDIMSLISVYDKKGRISNPYTRERINNETLFNIISLYKIIRIIHRDIISPEEYVTITRINQNTPVINRRSNTTIHTFQENPRVALMQKIIDLSLLTNERRIQLLFIDIDQLGNYTNSRWFSNLDKSQLLRFYRYLFDFWSFRGNLSNEVKRHICQLQDPFLNTRSPPYYIDKQIDTIQSACISVMEHMVYCGTDIEYRRLGTLHVLSALTIVSSDARHVMPWLYESVIF